MQDIGNAIRRNDIAPELAGYLREISSEKPLNFMTVREHIESGSGRFNEAEGIMLLLESIINPDYDKMFTMLYGLGLNIGFSSNGMLLIERYQKLFLDKNIGI